MLATLGTLPVRFLSIYALVVGILTFVCVRHIKTTVIGDDILFTVPLFYLGKHLCHVQIASHV